MCKAYDTNALEEEMAKVILKKKLYISAESWPKSPGNGGQLGRTPAVSGPVPCKIQRADSITQHTFKRHV